MRGVEGVTPFEFRLGTVKVLKLSTGKAFTHPKSKNQKGKKHHVLRVQRKNENPYLFCDMRRPSAPNSLPWSLIFKLYAQQRNENQSFLTPDS